MDERTEEVADNLFKTVKRNDLEIREAAVSPQTENRNNGAALIVTLQSGTQQSDQRGID